MGPRVKGCSQSSWTGIFDHLHRSVWFCQLFWQCGSTVLRRNVMSSMLAIIPKKIWLLWCVCSALFFLLAADVRYHGVVSKMDRPISEAFHNAGFRQSLIFRVGTEL